MGFYSGETIILSCETRDENGVLIDPDTSMNIILKNPDTTILGTYSMTKDSTGKYHYDFQSANRVAGKYIAKYVSAHGTRISEERDVFDLEE